MPVDTLVGICAVAAPITVALVLVLEAGLLIGIVLPAGSLVSGWASWPASESCRCRSSRSPSPPRRCSVPLSGTARPAGAGEELPVDGGVLGRHLPVRATHPIVRMCTLWREAIGRRPVRVRIGARPEITVVELRSPVG